MRPSCILVLRGLLRPVLLACAVGIYSAKMKSRLFTFGCSFTKYEWPTWADILSLDYEVFENWAQVGAGNHFILYSLTEAVARQHIGPDDTVAVMFTGVAREDRYIDGAWHTPGNVYGHLEFKDKEPPDPTGYFLTSLSTIDAVRRILDQVGCQYHLLSVVPFDVIDYTKSILFRPSVEKQAIELYKETLAKIKPSVYEVVYNRDWNNRKNSALPYSKKDVIIAPAVEILKAKYDENTGRDWPSFEDFMDNNLATTAQEIVDELENQYQFISWRDRILNRRYDYHPTPAEHFEYLDKVGFDLSTKQKDYAEQWNHKVLTLADIGFNPKEVKRF